MKKLPNIAGSVILFKKKILLANIQMTFIECNIYLVILPLANGIIMTEALKLSEIGVITNVLGVLIGI